MVNFFSRQNHRREKKEKEKNMKKQNCNCDYCKYMENKKIIKDEFIKGEKQNENILRPVDKIRINRLVKQLLWKKRSEV